MLEKCLTWFIANKGERSTAYELALEKQARNSDQWLVHTDLFDNGIASRL